MVFMRVNIPFSNVSDVQFQTWQWKTNNHLKMYFLLGIEKLGFSNVMLVFGCVSKLCNPNSSSWIYCATHLKRIFSGPLQLVLSCAFLKVASLSFRGVTWHTWQFCWWPFWDGQVTPNSKLQWPLGDWKVTNCITSGNGWLPWKGWLSPEKNMSRED